MSKTEQRSLAYWSGRSAEFSRLHMEAYGSGKRIVFAEQVAACKPRGDEVRALDLGCGSGFMSLLLLDSGCKVTGIDFSRDMLDRACENVRGKGYEADFLQMKAQDLRFPDGSFDFVVSRNVTWMLEDVGRVYAEVMRVLADGGVFLNIDANYGRSFIEAERRGEAPSHPTQTLEQLLERNEIARDLQITQVDRPQWDISTFWELGAKEVRCRRMGEGTNDSNSIMFALEVRKPTRRSEGSTAWVSAHVDVLSVGAFEFDSRKFVVRKAGVSVQLTPKEFNILLALALNAGHVVSRRQLVEEAWGEEYRGEASNLSVYIRRIRNKIEDEPSSPRHLLTCWGEGYMLAI